MNKRDLFVSNEDVDVPVFVQMKSEIGLVHEGNYVKFDLDIATYNKLRINRGAGGSYLVVLDVPDKGEDWITHVDDGLLLRKRLYWYAMTDAQEVKNKASIRLNIPTANVVCTDWLLSLFTDLRDRGFG